MIIIHVIFIKAIEILTRGLLSVCYTLSNRLQLQLCTMHYFLKLLVYMCYVFDKNFKQRAKTEEICDTA